MNAGEEDNRKARLYAIFHRRYFADRKNGKINLDDLTPRELADYHHQQRLFLENHPILSESGLRKLIDSAI